MKRTAVGEYRHPITIQQVTDTNAKGSLSEILTVFSYARAAKDDTGGREFFAAQQINAEIQTRFRIRYLAGVTAKMRVVFGAQSYEIAMPPVDPDGQKRELHLYCKAINPSGTP